MDFIAFYVIRGKILIDGDNEENTDDKSKSTGTKTDENNVVNDKETESENENSCTENGDIEHKQFELDDVEYIDKDMYEELQRKPVSETSSFIVEQYDEVPQPQFDTNGEIDVEQFVNTLNEELYNEEMSKHSEVNKPETNDDDDVINITELKRQSDDLVKCSINIGLDISDDDNEGNASNAVEQQLQTEMSHTENATE